MKNVMEVSLEKTVKMSVVWTYRLREKLILTILSEEMHRLEK